MTNERFRLRFTTALVVFSLLLITVPMLFDAPSVDYQTFAINGSGPLREERVQKLRQQLSAPLQKSPAVPRYEEVAPASDVIDRVRRLNAEVDEDGFNTEDGTRFGEPVLSPVRKNSRVLAVLVDESRDSKAALTLRDQLRNDGYEAFTSVAKRQVGGENSVENLVHRVAIGPLLSHTEARKMRDVLSVAMNLEARVVEMSQ